MSDRCFFFFLLQRSATNGRLIFPHVMLLVSSATGEGQTGTSAFLACYEFY